VAPWIYPPGYDSLFARFPESASPPSGGEPSSADPLERALIQAVVWQESKFDARARSRSDALGLMQLKLPAALDAARWLGESRPTEATLFDPATNLRYGEIYLKRLLARFDRRVSAALAAYNAGAGQIPPAWRAWLERGGEALIVELVPYPETRDYVKRILGVRQAYREIRPYRSAPP
jgi:soluble lytic murein transglycosylase